MDPNLCLPPNLKPLVFGTFLLAQSTCPFLTGHVQQLVNCMLHFTSTDEHLNRTVDFVRSEFTKGSDR